MSQQGQLVRLKTREQDGEQLWTYRYRVAGRGSKRIQRGGFTSEHDARQALADAIEANRRSRSQSITLTELVEAYLAQHVSSL